MTEKNLIAVSQPVKHKSKKFIEGHYSNVGLFDIPLSMLLDELFYRIEVLERQQVGGSNDI